MILDSCILLAHDLGIRCFYLPGDTDPNQKSVYTKLLATKQLKQIQVELNTELENLLWTNKPHMAVWLITDKINNYLSACKADRTIYDFKVEHQLEAVTGNDTWYITLKFANTASYYRFCMSFNFQYE